MINFNKNKNDNYRKLLCTTSLTVHFSIIFYLVNASFLILSCVLLVMLTHFFTFSVSEEAIKGNVDFASNCVNDEFESEPSDVQFQRERGEKIEQSLKSKLAEEKLYLDCDLDLQLLADSVGASKRELSNVIKNHLQSSFYELINEYRCREAAQRLCDKGHKYQKVIDIAADCGFANKSTFNRVFLNQFGMSPTMFRQSRQI